MDQRWAGPGPGTDKARLAHHQRRGAHYPLWVGLQERCEPWRTRRPGEGRRGNSWPPRGRGGAGEGRRRGRGAISTGPPGNSAQLGLVRGGMCWREGARLRSSRPGGARPPGRRRRGAAVGERSVSGGECWGSPGWSPRDGREEVGHWGTSGRCLGSDLRARGPWTCEEIPERPPPPVIPSPAPPGGPHSSLLTPASPRRSRTQAGWAGRLPHARGEGRRGHLGLWHPRALHCPDGQARWPRTPAPPALLPGSGGT